MSLWQFSFHSVSHSFSLLLVSSPVAQSYVSNITLLCVTGKPAWKYVCSLVGTTSDVLEHNWRASLKTKLFLYE